MTSDLLDFHAFCLTQTGTRLEQYAHAITQLVRDGQAVVDLGAGSGILSFLACRAGARRVYAIEASEAISLGELLAAIGGFRDRIEFIHTPSTLLVLPERVDAVVADIHDTFGLQHKGLASFMDARDRFLTPGGVLIPSSIQLIVAPVEAPDLYRKTIDVWRQDVQGVDVSPVRAMAVNQVGAGRFEPEQLLAPPTPLTTIDLTSVRSLHVGGSARASVTRDGTLHGVCGCFVTTLTDEVVMGNVPGDAGTTNFAQAFFPIDTPVPVRTGDALSMGVDTLDGAVTRWRVEVTRANGAPLRFEQSTFHNTVLPPGGLRKHAENYRPTLNAWGSMERALLERFDGTRPAVELEAWLAERFGETLPSRREAGAFLKAMIERCG